MHMIVHVDGSDNPIGVRSDIDKVIFHHFYVVKDFYGVIILLIALRVCVCMFARNILNCASTISAYTYYDTLYV